jgi:Helix-turn-helix domain
MEFSESRLADRLVLGAIAHRVSNDSGEAYPSIPTIAREANVSESTVYESLTNLQKLGEVDWEKAASPLGTNLYKLPKFRDWMETLHPPKSGGGRGSEVRKHPLRSTENTPPKSGGEPSFNHQKKPSEEKTSAASPQDRSLHRRFVQFAKENFKAKHGGRLPAWNGQDYARLADLLKRCPDLQFEELQRRWAHFVSSPQPFIRDQGDSLKFFCIRFDSFIDGPLFAAPVGGKNGNKLSIAEQGQRTRRVLEQTHLGNVAH